MALRVTGTFPEPLAFQEQLALRASLYSEPKTLPEKIPGYTLKFAQLPRAGRVPWGSPWAPVLEVYIDRRPWVETPLKHSAQREVIALTCARGIGRPGLGVGG